MIFLALPLDSTNFALMPPTSKHAKSSIIKPRNSNAKTKPTKEAPAIVVAGSESAEDEDDAGSDDEELGVEIDEEDEVSGAEDDGSESENKGSEDEDICEEEHEGVEGKKDVEVLLDEVESVDEDAVPRQKIEIDDEVLYIPH